jgi:CheY-like chemotaxis protein
MASIEERGALPDVVICDIAMPEEDGYGFVKRLRGFEANHGAMLAARGGPGLLQTPVVALSAFAAADRHGDIAHDFDAYLTKPVDPSQLLVTLYRLVISARRRAIPAP